MKFLVLLFVCLIAVQATRPPELEKFFASAAETVNELQKRDIARSFIVRSKPSRENDLSCLSDTSIEKCDGCSIADSWEAVVDTTECLDTSKEAPCYAMSQRFTFSFGADNQLSSEGSVVMTVNKQMADMMNLYIQQTCPTQPKYPTKPIDISIETKSVYAAPEPCTIETEGCPITCTIYMHSYTVDPCDGPYAGPVSISCSAENVTPIEQSGVSLEMSDDCNTLTLDVDPDNGTDGGIASNIPTKFKRLSDGGGSGIIIGIVLGVFAVCAVIGGLVYYKFYYKKQEVDLY